MGGRLIIDTGDEAHYEKPQDQQGWVKHFRSYLLENTSVTVVHNAAINGKSAKWFNAHKERCSRTTTPAMTPFSSCWAPMTAGTA